MICKVRVKLEYKDTRMERRKIVPYIAGHYMKILVEAETHDEAMDKAVAYAQANAPFGPKWESCEALEACFLELPLHIE
jgi:hypothetical protein